MANDRVLRELNHFNNLYEEDGNVWWGHLRPAGRLRLERRAGIIREWASRLPGAEVLEIGAGDGMLTRFLQDIPLKIMATDLSPVLIERAKESINSDNIKFSVANVERLEYTDGSFSGIFGNSVLHHLDLKICLREIFRVLKNEGGILFFEPNLMNPQILVEKKVKIIGRYLQNSPDETAFIRWNLKTLLDEFGFSDIEIVPFDFLHPIIPEKLVNAFLNLGRILERTPVLKEFSGSLIIRAFKKA